MNRIAAGIAAIGIGLTSSAAVAAAPYEATASVTFTWGNSGTSKGWTSSGPNSLSAMSNATQFNTLPGNNSTSYYNSDYATVATSASVCASGVSRYRQYGCIDSTFLFRGTPQTDPNNVTASGTLTVTATTMTGTLTLNATSDECVGPVATQTAVGCGTSGWNVRSADGSPFGNVWIGYGANSVSAGGGQTPEGTTTLTVNLTGTFTPTSWEITGGTVRIADSNNIACQMGNTGFATLCNPSTVIGGYSNDGSQLSWGVDLDGGGAGTAMGEITVKDGTGASTIASLAGVLASLAVDGGGAITTTYGETRGALGSSGSGCPDHIRWDTTKINCGTLTVQALSVTGNIVDAAPDPFTFTPQTDVALSTVVESNTITIAGVSPSAAVSISGGEYSKNGGAYTSAAGTVVNGDQIKVRQTSSALGSTLTTATLTVGSFSTGFNVTTVAADTSPDPINFGALIDQPLSTAVESNDQTITGINAATQISIVGGEYRINGGAYTSANGNVVNGDVIRLRLTTAATESTNTTAIVTVGDQAAQFSVDTGDKTPLGFTFTDVTGAPLSTPTTSNSISVFGITLPSPITITGGEYSINSGVFTSAAGTVTNGQTVVVRQTSSPNFSTTTNTVLNIGGVSDTFSVTTLAADTTPDAFTFTDQTNVAFNTAITSAPVTIAGINTGAPISVTVGEYSIDGGAFTNAAGTVTNGQQVRVRVTSSAAPSTAVNATLTVGGVSDTFTVTTQATPPDTTPNAFFFQDVENADLSTVVESDVVTITGMDNGTPIRISGPTGSNSQYRINGGAWTNAVGTINPGDTLQVRHTTASIAGKAVSSTVTIGNPSPAPSSQRYAAEFTSLTTPAGGGSSSMDFLALGLLGAVAFLRRRRPMIG